MHEKVDILLELEGYHAAERAHGCAEHHHGLGRLRELRLLNARADLSREELADFLHLELRPVQVALLPLLL